MQIFLSYASEDRPIAETIHLALLSAGHQVFFDQRSLPPGGDYRASIEEAVRRCDLVIFLISDDSVNPKSYALTELNYARVRWPHPAGRVLPVMIRNTDYANIPAYLRAVTVLEPVGDTPAEVCNAVARLRLKMEPANSAGHGGATSADMPSALIKTTGKDTEGKRWGLDWNQILVALIGLAGVVGAAYIATFLHKDTPLPDAESGNPEVSPYITRVFNCGKLGTFSLSESSASVTGGDERAWEYQYHPAIVGISKTGEAFTYYMYLPAEGTLRRYHLYTNPPNAYYQSRVFDRNKWDVKAAETEAAIRTMQEVNGQDDLVAMGREFVGRIDVWVPTIDNSAPHDGADNCSEGM